MFLGYSEFFRLDADDNNSVFVYASHRVSLASQRCLHKDDPKCGTLTECVAAAATFMH